MRPVTQRTRRGSSPPGSVVLFGGTFDPPHRSHRRLAAHVPHALDADLFVLPSGDHPHKGTAGTRASNDDRRAMCEAAFGDLARVRVDDRELRRPGKSYSLDTVRSFREELGPDVRIHWLIGSDNLAGLPRWHRYHELLAEAVLVTFPRAGHPVTAATLEALDLEDDERAALLRNVLPFDPDARSATAVRAELADRRVHGTTTFGIEALTFEVARHIAEHDLYAGETPRGSRR